MRAGGGVGPVLDGFGDLVLGRIKSLGGVRVGVGILVPPFKHFPTRKHIV